MPVGSSRGDDLRRLSLLDALTGSYASAVLHALCDHGALTILARWQTSAAVAELTGLDARRVTPVLQFLAIATEVIERDSRGRFRLGEPGLEETSFQLRKFVGAYGGPVLTLGASRVDSAALAQAFASTAARVTPIVRQHIASAGVRSLLDLGCGSGALLIDLARADSGFRGIGVEFDADMYRQAERSVKRAGLGRQIRIVRGDARAPEALLDKTSLARIDAVHGRSFLNALFGEGRAGAVASLSNVSRALPGRPAWFVDYYGRLGSRYAANGQALALLQDVAQVVSGQGVPPASFAAWKKIYRACGANLVEGNDFVGPEISWFIHELRFASQRGNSQGRNRGSRECSMSIPPDTVPKNSDQHIIQPPRFPPGLT